jgi:solute carrier family 25 carnitine/acylcarnitine transporter 20/29
MRVQSGIDQVEPTLHQIFLAGAGTGIVSAIITCPTELVKIRQQSTLDNAKLPGVWQITTSIYRQKGIGGLYRGFVPTGLRELGFGVYFLTVRLLSVICTLTLK